MERLGVSRREASAKAILICIQISKQSNAILLMSGATNGKRAVEGWKSMEEENGSKTC